jgi:hypothetical protein
MAENQIQKPKPPDRRLNERFLPDHSKQMADWLVRHMEMELLNLRKTVNLLLAYKREIERNDIIRLKKYKRYFHLHNFYRNRFRIHPESFFKTLEELKNKFPYDPLDD